MTSWRYKWVQDYMAATGRTREDAWDALDDRLDDYSDNEGASDD
jgi:hypothetical protein